MPKPSRSPLYFYASDYQRQQRAKGRSMNITEAIAACYDDWKALSDEAKQPYKNQNEQYRMDNRTNPASTNVSNQRNQVENHQRDIPSEELKQHYDRFSLERKFLAYEYLPLDKSELMSMPIYIINFQIFCKVDEEDGGQFIPAEMCILRYTLNDGVTMYRHKFIKSEQIPSGYMSSCLEHMKETHEIPLKDFAEATDNYKLIYQELKSFLIPTLTNKPNDISESDDRTRRRYLRLTQPCVFFPALEYEQTSKLLDWLQTKAEGIKPTKNTRLANLISIESLIMSLAQLKKHHVSRDDIQRTFENAAYSYLIQQRCPFHLQLGISHCSVVRCHAGAKLISSYLKQLYPPDRPVSATMSGKSSPMNNAANSMSNISNRGQQSLMMRSTVTSQQPIPDTTDSIASSYCPPEQGNYSNSSQITRLQQQNFHRLLSNAESSPFSSNNEANNHTTTQRTVLNHRRQILLQALQNIDQQIKELDIQ